MVHSVSALARDGHRRASIQGAPFLERFEGVEVHHSWLGFSHGLVLKLVSWYWAILLGLGMVWLKILSADGF